MKEASLQSRAPLNALETAFILWNKLVFKVWGRTKPQSCKQMFPVDPYFKNLDF